MTFIIYKIYFKENILKSHIKELLDFNFMTIRIFFKTAFPVIFNDFMWIAGITLYSKAYAILGTDAIATMQIATITNNLFNIFGTGIAVASSIVIGNSIGAGEPDKKVQKDAYKMSEFCVIIGIAIGIVFFLTAPFVNRFFNTSPQVQKDIVSVLRIMAVALPFRFSWNNTNYRNFKRRRRCSVRNPCRSPWSMDFWCSSCICGCNIFPCRNRNSLFVCMS